MSKYLLIAISLEFFLSSIGAAEPPVSHDLLIEYSYGSNLLGKENNLSLLPPATRIHQDGYMIFYDDGRYYSGMLRAKRLAQLKKELSAISALRKSMYYEYDKGIPINVTHGGMAYIRYQSGNEHVILACNVWPKHGPFRHLIALINKYIPPIYSYYYPEEMKVSVSRWSFKSGLPSSSSLEDSLPWPFHNIQLPESATYFLINDNAVVNYLFSTMQIWPFGVYWRVNDDGQVYTLLLSNVPNWFDQQDTYIQLMNLNYQAGTSSNGVAP